MTPVQFDRYRILRAEREALRDALLEPLDPDTYHTRHNDRYAWDLAHLTEWLHLEDLYYEALQNAHIRLENTLDNSTASGDDSSPT